MLLSDLPKERLDTATLECWQRERMTTHVRAFAVRIHAVGFSLRETETVLRLLGVDRSFHAIWQWVTQISDILSGPPTAKPRRVAATKQLSKSMANSRGYTLQ